MFTHLEVLVEEYSAEVALHNLLPKILPDGVEFEIRSFQGKADLIRKLPQRLKGYRSWIPSDWRILVLCDRDQEDCYELKKKLEDYAILSGFTTKSSYPEGHFTVVNRIAIEELEAWFLGDSAAVIKAYPRVSANFSSQSRYRNPDGIMGTWEALQALLQGKKYHLGGLNKVEAAREISQYMEPTANRSPSFQIFYEGIASLSNPRMGTAHLTALEQGRTFPAEPGSEEG
jgi:hypothetical protein